jgi:hypothetical protein
MSELLKDKVFKEFMLTKPKVPRVMKRMGGTPWVVYVQQEVDGPWGKKEFETYGPAFQFFKAWLKRGAHDLAINNRRIGFDPPLRFARIRGKYITGSDGVRRQATKAIPWKPRLDSGDPDHKWCRYCRRPTIFKYYSKHKRLTMVDPTVRRCCICGASERIALMPYDRRRA